MASTADDRNNKPVTGYPAPPGYHPAQPSYNPNGYPPAQPSYNPNGYPPAQPSNYYTSTAAAYAYSAPPPPSYYPAPPYNPRRTTFLRRLIIAGIAALVIVGAITFILWLVLRPHLPIFQVDSASVSSFNASGSQVSGDWDIGLTVRNPNKKIKIYYDRIDASVFYQSEYLAETALAPFNQGKKNETKVQASFTARSVYVVDSAVRLLVDDRSRGEVSFKLRMLAWVRFKAGGWRTRRHLMRVFCEDVKIGVSSNTGAGTLVGGSKDCDVNL